VTGCSSICGRVPAPQPARARAHQARGAPGHYLHRLKTVNATLTLQSHAIRHTADPGAQYPAEVDVDGLA
jgi:hypothetical protein